MAADIKLTDAAVQVEGLLSVNEPAPQRTVHVTGQEIHSGGPGAGFSFGNRESGFVNVPPKGERWVWYASAGTARLWSGSDKISINAEGHVSAFITSGIRPFFIRGAGLLGRPAAVWLQAQDVILSKLITEDGTNKAAHPEDKQPINNYALSHMPGDTLVLNRGGGFKGGVTIEGKVTIGGKDVAAELAALRAELDALKAKVK